MKTKQRAADVGNSAFTWADAQAGARALSPTSDPINTLSGIVIAADALIVLLSSVGAWFLRHGFTVFPVEVASISLLALALNFNAMQAVGAYCRQLTASAMCQVTAILRAWSVVFILLLLLAYFTKTSDSFSRAWVIGWYALAFVGFSAARFISARTVRLWLARGRLARTLAVVDLAGRSEELVKEILDHSGECVRLVGVFAPERTAGRKNSVSDLIALARLFRIDEVIVAVSARNTSHGGADIDTLLRRLSTIPTNVRLSPDFPLLAVPPLDASLMFGQPVLTVCHRPLTGWNRVAKRWEDVIIGLLATLFLLPLMLFTAFLIKIDSPGPVFFRQKRLGFNNNEIVIYKFRSMTHHRPLESGVPQARRNDARVTRLGKFLRRSSIDELPQLINVLKGEMSLVGPRPHALAHNEEYAVLIDDYLGRHRMQPGITGWAQVNGYRGETDTLEKMQRRVEHDLAYIDRWSLLLDIRIMSLTILRSVFDKNAY